MSALLSSGFIKLGADKLHETSVVQHLDVLTDHFALVTSNLMNEYTQCSEVVTKSFVDKDTSKVHDAVQKLING